MTICVLVSPDTLHICVFTSSLTSLSNTQKYDTMNICVCLYWFLYIGGAQTVGIHSDCGVLLTLCQRFSPPSVWRYTQICYDYEVLTSWPWPGKVEVNVTLSVRVCACVTTLSETWVNESTAVKGQEGDGYSDTWACGGAAFSCPRFRMFALVSLIVKTEDFQHMLFSQIKATYFLCI